MKKYTFLLFITFGINAFLFSQNNPPCYYTPNWDWTDPSSTNWNAFPDGTLAGLGTAFGNSPVNADLYKIISAKDYLPSQGWVLLHKNFGCPGEPVQGGYPWFILYNKFKSVVRIFFNTNRDITTSMGQMEAKWLNNQHTSLFTLYNDFPLTNNQYPRNNSEIPMNVIEDFFPKYAWSVTDFMVNFDQNTSSFKDAYELLFKLYNIQTSTFDIDGGLEFSTKSSGVQEATSQDNPDQSVNWITKGKKMLAKIPSEDDLKKNFDEIYKAGKKFDEIACSDFSSKVNNAVEKINNGKFKQAVLGGASLAGGLSGGLGLLASVADIFIGKANTDAASNSTFQPTLSSGSLKLKGEITSKLDETQMLLQLPGTKHTYPNGDLKYNGLPIYDCPLGVVALEKVPVITRKQGKVKNGWLSCHQCSGDGITPRFLHLNSYRMTNNLDIAFNKTSELKISNIKAAFVGVPKAENDTTPIYDLFKKGYSFGCTSINSFDKTSSPDCSSIGSSYVNVFLRDFLNKSVYNLNLVDSFGFHKFSTPFIALEDFKNTSFTVPIGTDVFIKIVATLIPVSNEYDQTPVFYTFTYKISDNNIIDDPISIDGIYGSTYEQLVEIKPQRKIVISVINQGIYNGVYHLATDGEVNVLPIEDVLFEANGIITLRPGFHAKATSIGKDFGAKIIRENYVEGENALVLNEYFASCDPYANNNFGRYLDASGGIKDNGLKLFPNPSRGMVALSIKYDEEQDGVTVKISDLMGREVYSLKDQDVLEKTYEIDLSNQPNGIYLVHVITAKGVKIEKITLSK